MFQILIVSQSLGQNCSSLNIQLESDITSSCNNMVMTMLHDQLGRPYLYVANKEAGLTIFDISTISSPTPVDTIQTNLFDTLHVMNLTQDGNYLYLAIGNHFTNPQKGGLAIIDVTNPTIPVLEDYYVLPSSANGAGIVKVEGNYAYLGAMKSGVVILDVTNKNNIIFVSQFVPDINFPVLNPNSDLYNARGMEVKNSIVYLCYDAGGFRVINCIDKNNPIETGRYANPTSYTPFNLPRAYNNIILDDSLVFISVDYCGVEVLNISDTSNITLSGWWNPYNCPNNNWFSSPVHSNEMYYDNNCKHLFVSTGKSDLVVIDVSDPTQPDSCNFYGGGSNSIATWGVSSYQNKIFLSYICALIPFSSNWTGVKILTYTPCSANSNEGKVNNRFSIFPNPAQNSITLNSKNWVNKSDAKANITNIMGEILIQSSLLSSSTSIDISSIPQGLYMVQIENGTNYVQKFIKQ